MASYISCLLTMDCFRIRGMELYSGLPGASISGGLGFYAALRAELVPPVLPGAGAPVVIVVSAGDGEDGRLFVMDRAQLAVLAGEGLEQIFVVLGLDVLDDLAVPIQGGNLHHAAGRAVFRGQVLAILAVAHHLVEHYRSGWGRCPPPR